LEREAPAHGGADGDALDDPRGTNEIDGPAQDQIVRVDVLDCALLRTHLVGGDHRAERREWMSMSLRDDDRHLLFLGRVAEGGLERKAVELRLGQWERSLLLDWVLRCDHEKRLRQEARRAVDGHLRFR